MTKVVDAKRLYSRVRGAMICCVVAVVAGLVTWVLDSGSVLVPGLVGVAAVCLLYGVYFKAEADKASGNV